MSVQLASVIVAQVGLQQQVRDTDKLKSCTYPKCLMRYIEH